MAMVSPPGPERFAVDVPQLRDIRPSGSSRTSSPVPSPQSTWRSLLGTHVGSMLSSIAAVPKLLNYAPADGHHHSSSVGRWHGPSENRSPGSVH